MQRLGRQRWLLAAAQERIPRRSLRSYRLASCQRGIAIDCYCRWWPKRRLALHGFRTMCRKAHPATLRGSSAVCQAARDRLIAEPELEPGMVAGLEGKLNDIIVDFTVLLLDSLYPGRTKESSFARFYVLETIARVPYFAFTSVLHLYETLGWWRRCDYLKIHFAESWNELHHLMIMEALGGNKRWADRAFAQHVAVFYFWFVVAMYLVRPRMAYNFMEKVEHHAYETYDKFLQREGDTLRSMPPPPVAVRYYQGRDDVFEGFTSHDPCGSEGAAIRNLHDVFVHVRDDEAVHVKTMQTCQTSVGLVYDPNDSTCDSQASMECRE
eukprot:jgi/Mesvir1/26152/Mv06857-RA.1